MITVEGTVMKKLFSILGLVGFAGALAVCAGVGAKEFKAAKATSTYFTFGETGEIAANGTAGNFRFYNNEGCEAKPGSIVDKNDTYWNGDGYFNGLDNFFKGESAGWAGIMKSDTWVQSSTDKYVYFTWTGDAQTIRIYADGVNDAIETLANDYPNGNAMVVNFIKIPDAYCDGTKVLHLELEDPSTNDDGYRFSNFGYCHVNASAQEVSDAIWKHIEEGLHTNTGEAKLRYNTSLATYSKEKYKPLNGLSANARKNVNEDFENNALFLQRWQRDTVYDRTRRDDGFIAEGLERIGDNEGKVFEDNIISTFTNRGGGDNLPINKTGSGFFKGYHEGGYGAEGDQGFIIGDRYRYRFVSKPFVLSGTGFISIKMAGNHTSLHVLRGTGRDAGRDTEFDLAWINRKVFQDSGNSNNVAESGFNTVTLVRHVINLSAFKDEIIQLAIADTEYIGWSASNFDELITYYADVPQLNVDSATQTVDNVEMHPYFRDVYVSKASSNAAGGIEYLEDSKKSIVDNSDEKAAYDFINYYWDNFRTKGSFFSFCNVSAETKSDLISRYSALSKEAQEIVDDNDDFDYGEARSGDWYRSNIRVGGDAQTVGYNTQYIARKFNITGIEIKNTPMVSSNQMELPVVMNNTILVVVLISTLVALTFVMFIALKKRKQN